MVKTRHALTNLAWQNFQNFASIIYPQLYDQHKSLLVYYWHEKTATFSLKLFIQRLIFW